MCVRRVQCRWLNRSQKIGGGGEKRPVVAMPLSDIHDYYGRPYHPFNPNAEVDLFAVKSEEQVSILEKMISFFSAFL